MSPTESQLKFWRNILPPSSESTKPHKNHFRTYNSYPCLSPGGSLCSETATKNWQVVLLFLPIFYINLSFQQTALISSCFMLVSCPTCSVALKSKALLAICFMLLFYLDCSLTLKSKALPAICLEYFRRWLVQISARRSDFVTGVFCGLSRTGQCLN
jgi:hypothetical protein